LQVAAIVHKEPLPVQPSNATDAVAPSDFGAVGQFVGSLPVSAVLLKLPKDFRLALTKPVTQGILGIILFQPNFGLAGQRFPIRWRLMERQSSVRTVIHGSCVRQVLQKQSGGGRVIFLLRELF
jgi:hypothetical protein